VDLDTQVLVANQRDCHCGGRSQPWLQRQNCHQHRLTVSVRDMLAAGRPSAGTGVELITHVLADWQHRRGLAGTLANAPLAWALKPILPSRACCGDAWTPGLCAIQQARSRRDTTMQPGNLFFEFPCSLHETITEH
jgi:hypothetical protein